ncbi:ATP-grasp domain-containing protein [Chondromyces apiculatus]|uniref:Ribosomal protein S6 glutaminyl transferase n=1 Tax=Chondromyces apiculatus DSM 436 TaxID=1192034 RepID=A0A017TID9_9BACT|nr:hypothetical protein [Chondromyces apiculatus]EYF08396.1 Hypothetical protein CAP_3925 [Chondromyces apiculatus DSM 436]
METRFLFITGEPAAALPLLKERAGWGAVVSATTFDVTAGRLHRRRNDSDDFRGVLYFADVRDKDLERHTLGQLAAHAIPCWPDPEMLLAVSARHAALARCVAAGLVDHPVVQAEFTREPQLPFPYVLKVGEEHRGEGKHLIRSARDIPRWEGVASMEPFFKGESVRVLLLGERAFGARIVNKGSWIKNGPGASFEPWTPGEAIMAHARQAMRLFGLEIAGVDYVIDGKGFHFIEVNPFPRVGLSKESLEVAVAMFREAMGAIEGRAALR